MITEIGFHGQWDVSRKMATVVPLRLATLNPYQDSWIKLGVCAGTVEQNQ